MPYFEAIAEYSDVIRKLETVDPAHADIFNEMFQILLNNDKFFKEKKLDKDLKGSAGGLAELDESGLVPSRQLPSYVDDVVEGYYYDGSFYLESGHVNIIPGESGKIYVDLPSGKSWRWTGNVFVAINDSAARADYAEEAGKVNGHTVGVDVPSDAKFITEDDSGNVLFDKNRLRLYRGVLPNNTNLDDVKVDGQYYLSNRYTYINKPDGVYMGILDVKTGEEDYTTQIIYKIETPPTKPCVTYRRNMMGAYTFDWYRYAMEDDLEPLKTKVKTLETKVGTDDISALTLTRELDSVSATGAGATIAEYDVTHVDKVEAHYSVGGSGSSAITVQYVLVGTTTTTTTVYDGTTVGKVGDISVDTKDVTTLRIVMTTTNPTGSKLLDNIVASRTPQSLTDALMFLYGKIK